MRGQRYSLLAAGVVAQSQEGVIIERPQTTGALQSPRTTKLHLRAQGEIPLDEVERIVI
jgi:hypothetical protein